MYKHFFKRFFDFILSFVAIIVLSPIFIILSFLVLCNVGAPIFFKQKRVGKNEKVFTMYKFRTMSNKKDKDGKLLPDNQRVTRFGRFLRSTSLDELPELFNILKGDLSIIGPRPLLVEYLPYYTQEERHRHDVRGGLTVPEVLHDNVTPTWEEQFSYEVDYAKNLTLWLDIKILFYTIRILFKRIKEDYGSEVRKPLSEERKDWLNETGR
ncbi:MAG: sugar transferase [Clostridiales bacterium]|nr:sugar transferase [Clostridiales bacterium]